MKILPSILLLFIVLSNCSGCKLKYKVAKSREKLKMPQLVDVKAFKSALPLDKLNLISKAYEDSIVLVPTISYSFAIDKHGDVIKGRSERMVDEKMSFFYDYLQQTFSAVRWKAAYYEDRKNEKLKSVVHLLLGYNENRKRWELTFRLTFLPEVEKLEDVQMQDNFIYEFYLK